MPADDRYHARTNRPRHDPKAIAAWRGGSEQDRRTEPLAKRRSYRRSVRRFTLCARGLHERLGCARTSVRWNRAHFAGHLWTRCGHGFVSLDKLGRPLIPHDDKGSIVTFVILSPTRMASSTSKPSVI